MRFRSGLLVAALFVCASNPLWSQDSGLRWASPEAFSYGNSAAGGLGSTATLANPASAATEQRTTLDLSYFIVPDLATSLGVAHWVNAGALFPTKIGVFAADAQFAYSPFTASNLPDFGYFFSLHGAFSKDIDDKLDVGIGLGFQYGNSMDPANPVASVTRDDWGLGLDLGFIYKFGDAGFLTDFNLGVALRNLGKSMQTPWEFGGTPPNFTPAVGTSFNLVKTNEVQWAWQADLSFPVFQNLVFAIGTRLDLFDIVTATVSTEFDVRKLVAATERNVPVSFGVSIRIPTDGQQATSGKEGDEGPKRTGEFNPSIAAGPVNSGVWVFGLGVRWPIGVIDKVPPKVELGAVSNVIENVSYISPNFDGVHDELHVPISIQDGRPIGAYALTIKDAQGKVVRTIRNKEVRPETIDFGSFWARFAREKNGLNVPTELVWDGRNDDGAIVPDGRYTWEVSAEDDNGNQSVTPARLVEVDTATPGLLLTAPDDRGFAPGGDRPFFTFGVQASPEDEYTGEILDANGKVIKTFHWKSNTAPSKEGDAGTKDTTAPGTGQTDTKPTSYEFQGGGEIAGVISAPTGMGQAAPDTTTGSGASTSTTTSPTSAVPWLPPQIQWDGTTDSGELAPDGVYTFKITTKDRAGNTSSAQIDNILLVNQATPITLIVDNPWFSPNGDGIKDTVTVSIQANESVKVQKWEAGLYSADSKLVRLFSGLGAVPRSILLDGKDNAGKALPEGKYQLRLAVLYVNGNKPQVNSPVISLRTTPPAATVTSDFSVFSPSGQRSSIKLAQNGSDEQLWRGVIRESGKNVDLVTFTFHGKPDPTLVWDGKNNAGQVLPDGSYTYQLFSTDQAGNSGESAPLVLTIDNRQTSVAVQSDRGAISAKTDSANKTVNFTFSYPVKDGIAGWELRLISTNDSRAQATDTAARSWKGNGPPPDQVTWDGRDESKTVMSDGRYYPVVFLNYQKGDRARGKGSEILLDSTGPAATVNAPEAVVRGTSVVFSPDGDGNNDTLKIVQSASPEKNWVMKINDGQNRTIKTTTWSSAPATYVWDGTDQNGNKVADGEYSYSIEAVDEAGNKGSAVLTHIVVDTRPTPVSLSIEQAAFSPGSNGPKPLQTFYPHIGIAEGLKTVTLVVSGVDGAVAWKSPQISSKPDSIVWDGKTNEGKIAAEGNYIAEVQVAYDKGNVVTAKSPTFVLRTTPPKATITADLQLFSPDGDGKKDQVRFAATTSIEQLWLASIRYANPPAGVKDPVVWKDEYTGTAPSTIVWDGRSPQGALIPDGTYILTLEATDEAGNKGTSNPVSVTVDRRPTALQLKADQRWINPTGAGSSSSVNYIPIIGLADGISSWELRVVPQATDGAKPVRVLSGQGNPPLTITWDGKDDSGKLAPDGDFSASLKLVYTKGNEPVASSSTVSIDTQAPSITLSITDALFSPDGSSSKQVTRISQKSSKEDQWEGKMLDAGGKVVRTWYWRGLATDFSWDGRDDNGNPLPDGIYSYSAYAKDEAGNSSTKTLSPITIDTKSTPILITAQARGFAPGTGRANVATMTFIPVVSNKSGVVGWTLAMTQQDGTIERTLTGSGLPPESIVWDGYKSAGAAGAKRTDLAREGKYEAVFTVEYHKGNKPTAKSTSFILDVTGPKADLSISPNPFSPDDDGIDDEVNIGIAVDDLSPIADWNLSIYEPGATVPDSVGIASTRAPFMSFSSLGQPTSRLVWNGLSSKGELVQAAEDYAVVLTITDNLGNRSTVKSNIGVDVLVLKDGDQLRIRIPGITFPGDSADLNSATLDADKLEKNRKTLDRLAVILKKYSSYKVMIEGHANPTINPGAPGSAEENTKTLIPLSQRRAIAVMNALIQRGIAASRLTTTGMGGTKPLVSITDKDNLWKNRRVEFILQK